MGSDNKWLNTDWERRGFRFYLPGTQKRVLEIPIGYKTTAEADGIADFVQRVINSHDELLEMTKLLERSLVYEIKKSEREGDDEGANLKAFTLAEVRATIARGEG